MVKLYTIGYTAFRAADFADVLAGLGVQALVDVRSVPYSARAPEYNSEQTERLLKPRGILYENYAREFGARQTERQYFSEGYLDFEKFAQAPRFLQGIDKLRRRAEENCTIALMCAEKDPATCHRAILVSRALCGKGFEVLHILADGRVESQGDLELRLLDKYFLDRNQMSLFGIDAAEDDGTAALIRAAYRKRNAEIGYRWEDANHENSHNRLHEENRTAIFWNFEG
ncbi:MAG: DUF488 domain-containing protein [Oscillospiraceae bacterium]|jgi:uncharacterized protein (DUF488 family)|nr:DUF488 domain-containing protein [Oscillospiraceae bacterium]